MAMGYESRLIIGGRGVFTTASGALHLITIADLHLSKCGSLVDWRAHVLPDAPPVFIFGSDGDTEIELDPYGDPLLPMDVRSLREAMHAANRREPYRRFALAAAVLDQFAGREWDGEDVVAVHYGY